MSLMLLPHAFRNTLAFDVLLSACGRRRRVMARLVCVLRQCHYDLSTRLHHLSELERPLRAIRICRVATLRRHVVHRIVSA